MIEFQSRPRKAEWTKVKCGYCGKEFEKSPAHIKQRLKNSKSGNLFCSYSCSKRSSLGMGYEKDLSK